MKKKIFLNFNEKKKEKNNEGNLYLKSNGFIKIVIKISF